MVLKKWRYILFSILLSCLACFGISGHASAASQKITLDPSATFEWGGTNRNAVRDWSSDGTLARLTGDAGTSQSIYLTSLSWGANLPANSLVYFTVRFMTNGTVNITPFSTSDNVALESYNCFQPENSQFMCGFTLRTGNTAAQNVRIYSRTAFPNATYAQIQVPKYVQTIDLTSNAIQEVTGQNETTETNTLNSAQSQGSNAGSEAQTKGTTLLGVVSSLLYILNSETDGGTCVLPAAQFNQWFTWPSLDFCQLQMPATIMTFGGLVTFGASIFIAVKMTKRMLSLYNELVGGK